MERQSDALPSRYIVKDLEGNTAVRRADHKTIIVLLLLHWQTTSTPIVHCSRKAQCLGHLHTLSVQ